MSVGPKSNITQACTRMRSFSANKICFHWS